MPDLDADPDYRWGVEAVLRQSLLELENGAHVGLMLIRLKRALKTIEHVRDVRYGEGPGVDGVLDRIDSNLRADSATSPRKDA